jgi:Protein of unknown function (DUF4230)
MTRRSLWLAISVALLLVSGLVAWLVWRDTKRRVVETLTKPREETIPIATLVTRVRDLSRLETASMRVVHVSKISQSYKLIPNAIAGDELTFFATGDVIAGVDLSQLRENDVRRDPDGTLVLRLPPPMVLVTRLDNKESRVISRKTGVLRRADVDLESRVRQYAEGGIRSEAVRRGILPLASRNAEAKLAAFIHTLGASKVRFDNSAMPMSETPSSPR